MKDWAYEKAEYVSGWPGVYLSRVQLIGLTALFEQVRIEALEEAAKIADSQAISDQLAAMDFDVDASFSCEQIAERIRELKKESPEPATIL